MLKPYEDGGTRPEPGVYTVDRIVIGLNGYPTQYHGLEKLHDDPNVTLLQPTSQPLPQDAPAATML